MAGVAGTITSSVAFGTDNPSQLAHLNQSVSVAPVQVPSGFPIVITNGFPTAAPVTPVKSSTTLRQFVFAGIVQFPIVFKALNN